MAGDFNGDGKADLAKVFDGGTGTASIDVHLSTGSSFNMARWATGQGGVSDAQKWIAGDFNGDRKTDLAKVFDGGQGSASIDVHVSSGASFAMERWASLFAPYSDGQKWVAGNFSALVRTELASVSKDSHGSAIITVFTPVTYYVPR